MIRKMVLFASVALVAVAVAAPAAAQAEFTHEGEPLVGHAEIEMEGELVSHSPFGLGTFGCVVDMTLTVEGPTTEGQVTEYSPRTETCAGTGIFNGCKLESHASSVPLAAHVNTANDTIVITNLTIHNVYAGCSQTTSHQVIGSLVATPDDPGAIGSLSVSATATNGATFTGALEVTPASTYGVS